MTSPEDEANCSEDASETDLPEWVPNEYEPDAPLRERLPLIAKIDGGIEIHVQGHRGTVQVVHQPQHFSEYDSGEMKLDCGTRPDDWKWEIVIPASDDRAPFLRKVNPNQSAEAYHATRRTWLRNIDVRVRGVDVDRFDSGGDEAQAGA